ncbi:transcriptional regulator [Flavivirga aquatica]|uniref:Transcriptional regulator n=1 Tax=Flavivirga aquatica TaxID=1849968 RepID=A0A1E5SHJ1_9FLAO|nr:GNAT family N-acetyltransferase [Flavivirga aquatica]OEJ98578.1 transcriptional regulator [Flavivirga aquatica]
MIESNIEIKNTVFSNPIDNFGTIHLRYLDFKLDIETIHNWVTQPYASYWGMLDKTLEEVQFEYEKLVSRKDYDVFIGIYKGESVFLMEKYKASSDRISQYYNAKPTDYGMHILVAPPERKISGFTWQIFTTVLEYFFNREEVDRIVVEPDVRNDKIHKLNKKAGFQYQKEIQLPEKKAFLAFCEHKDYVEAKKRKHLELKPIIKEIVDTPTKASVAYLSPKVWEKVNKTLVRKAISEFSHELVLKPETIKSNSEYETYRLVSDVSEITYEFNAKKRFLEHWDIDENTIVKKHQENNVTIDAIQFIIEFRDTLGIPEHLLAVYLEEVSSTLSSAAYKYSNQEFSSQELVNCSFQIIEHAMSEGHPCFVANNGRIGFNNEEYIKYAPETNQSFKIYWLAGHKSKATFTAIKTLQYNSLMQKELGTQVISKFNTKLEALGLDTASYVFIPVHPWQWNNKIVQIFATDIANKNLVFLGESTDLYSAQQSIRTLYNKSNPEKMYTKTALSILNMGFMRGLSPYYMQSTPHITAWISELLEKDAYLKQIGFAMLGEVATVGFQNTNYEVLGKTNAHNKMLSALWRESPHSKIKEGEQLMTMAAFLHIDKDENALVSELIKASPYNTSTWVEKYLQAYLSPLLHCFYNYGFVFMPHGENIIMVMEDNTPINILMKDITEEVIVFNPELDLPEKVKRLYVETSDDMKVLTIFTDVFDCFFRFLGSILMNHLNYPEDHFWEQVARCIHNYQLEHPNLQANFDRYNLFTPEFDRCCLNRLQLKNTKQMLDLADPMESLIFKGTLQNPISKFKKIDKRKYQSEIIEHH